MSTQTRRLICADCLEAVKNMDAHSVDLIYLDPPFNSNQYYNLPFKSFGKDAAAVEAFKDIWTWDDATHGLYADMHQCTSPALARFIQHVKELRGGNDKMSAYLVNMSVRLWALRRVLKETGSIYLHCDPTASHYLKIIMDHVFGKDNFRNEIVWRRDAAGKGGKKKSHQYPRNADTILYYAAPGAKYHQPFAALSESQKKPYRYTDETGRKYKAVQLGNYTPKSIERMKNDHLIHVSANGKEYKKYYLDEAKATIGSIWTDIPGFGTRTASRERLGYPTQKPLALLERIVLASSDEGDVILDPFCGCGTTVHSAEMLNRQWIGCDISRFSVGVIRNRLLKSFEHLEEKHIRHEGIPKDIAGARDLAKQDPWEFEKWACGQIGAIALYKNPGAKGADGGIDGVLEFYPDKGKLSYAIVQVKGGGVNSDPMMSRHCMPM